MSDSSFYFEEGEVFEIFGNLSYTHYDDNVEWEVKEGSYPAYIGKIVTEKDGWFHGWIVQVSSINTIYGIEDNKHLVFGRFVEGRNGKPYTIFLTGHWCRYTLWIKKKIDGENTLGIFTQDSYNSDRWKEYLFEGYFTFKCRHVKKSDAQTRIIDAEYANLTSSESGILSKTMVEDFESIKEAMLDLIDNYEDLIPPKD